MTAHMKTVFDYLRRYWSEHGKSPSWREIGAACGLKGPGSVFDVLKRLEGRGCIRRAGKFGKFTWIPFLDGKGL